MEVHGEHGEPHRQRGDDEHRREQRAPAEAALAVVVELTELGDRGRGRLGSGRERHRHRESEDHRHQRGRCRTGERRLPVGDDGTGEAPDKHRDGEDDEGDRHQGEDEPAAVAEPGQAGNGYEEHEVERDAHRRKVRDVGDQRAAAGGDRDRDRQREVDDQRADWQERGGLAEGLARGLRGAAALREHGDELPVVERDERDDRDHQTHRRDQQLEVPVERPQRRLDRIGDRRNGIGHHREGEGEEEDGPRRQASARVTRRCGAGRDHGQLSPTRLPGTPRNKLARGCGEAPREVATAAANVPR